MEEKNVHIDELITLFLSGQLNPEGKEKLNAWIAQSEEHRAYFMHRQEVWFSAIQEKERVLYDSEAAFRKFQTRVEAHRTSHKSAPIWGWVKYAAVVALVGLVAYFSYQRGGTDLKNDLADIEMQAPIGSQAHVRLPDGTSVVLNAGSRIVYAQDFGVDSREVRLQGEGYFEVAHNAEVPFYVRSENLQVKVLGTKFNFRDYPEDADVVVSLIEGKVTLKNEIRTESEKILMPEERVILNKREGFMKVERKANIAADTQWGKGILSFDETLLPEVINVLERTYGVTIRLQTDSLAVYRFYGRFNRSEQTIQDVLEALKATGKIRYAKKDQTIILY